MSQTEKNKNDLNQINEQESHLENAKNERLLEEDR